MKIYIFRATFAALLCMVPLVSVQAQSLSDLQKQIETLLQQVVAMQKKQGVETNVTTPKSNTDLIYMRPDGLYSIPWDPPGDEPVIDPRGSVVTAYVGKRQFSANAYDTLLVRWDNKFDFTDDTECQVQARYGASFREVTIRNSALGRDHIGVYIPVTERYYQSNVNRVTIRCTEDGDPLYRTVFQVKVPQKKVLITASVNEPVLQSGVDTLSLEYSISPVPAKGSVEMKIKNMRDGSDYPLISPMGISSETNQTVDLRVPREKIPQSGRIVYIPSLYRGLLPIAGPLEIRVYDAEQKLIGKKEVPLIIN